METSKTTFECMPQSIDKALQLLNDLMKLNEQEKSKTDVRFITRKQVSELLSISMPTVHEYMNNGTLKHYKIGNKTLFSRDEVVESVLNSNTGKR